MTRPIRHSLVALLFALATAPAFAQPAAPPTAVLATLTVKAGARAEIQKTLPQEVRDTVQLYLDGKIQQWFARGDGAGVVFILNATSVADAKAITDRLPLVKAGLATFEFMPLTPLTPLRLLLNDAPPKEER
ncbi:MAG TPA: hypothetical protein VFA27_06625 [Vicinamibacterales bacterium]|nr:hypothetical protein [Vicinamibacterales bacterium]